MLLQIMIYLRHDLASVYGKMQSTMKYSLLKRENLSRFIETLDVMTLGRIRCLGTLIRGLSHCQDIHVDEEAP